MADRTFNVYLTTRQIAVLNALKKHFVETSKIPNRNELCELLGLSPGVINGHLSKFREAGIIKRIPDHQRGTMQFGRVPYRIIDCGNRIRRANAC